MYKQIWNKSSHSYLCIPDHSNNMKNNKYHTVGTVPKSNIKIVERGKIETHKYMTSHILLLGTGTSIKSGGVKLLSKHM